LSLFYPAIGAVCGKAKEAVDHFIHLGERFNSRDADKLNMWAQLLVPVAIALCVPR